MNLVRSFVVVLIERKDCIKLSIPVCSAYVITWPPRAVQKWLMYFFTTYGSMQPLRQVKKKIDTVRIINSHFLHGSHDRNLSYLVRITGASIASENVASLIQKNGRRITFFQRETWRAGGQREKARPRRQW